MLPKKKIALTITLFGFFINTTFAAQKTTLDQNVTPNNNRVVVNDYNYVKAPSDNKNDNNNISNSIVLVDQQPGGEPNTFEYPDNLNVDPEKAMSPQPKDNAIDSQLEGSIINIQKPGLNFTPKQKVNTGVLRHKINELEQQNLYKDATLTFMAVNYSKIKECNKMFEELNSSMKKDSENINKQMAQLKEELKKKNNIISDNNEEIKGLKKDLKDNNEKIKGLKKDLKDSNEEIKGLKNNLKDSNEEIKGLKNNLKDSNEEIKGLKKDLKDSNDIIANIKKENKKLKLAIAQEKKITTEQNDEIARHKERVTYFEETYADEERRPASDKAKKAGRFLGKVVEGFAVCAFDAVLIAIPGVQSK